METARRALALAGCVCALAGVFACAGGGGGRPASLVTPDSCTLGRVTEQKLALEDGRAVYVEPSTIAGTARRFLLAGTPAIVWPLGADVNVAPQPTDSIIGVVVEGRRATGVLPPAGYRNIGDVRAVALPDGRWGIEFLTFAAPLDPSKSPKATGVWFGMHDGTQWGRIERVPVPDSLAPMHGIATRIVQMGDTLAWAFVTQGSPLQRAVLAKRAPDGSWGVEVLPIPYPAMLDVAASTRGLVVAATEGDTAFRGEASALFLYTPSSTGWRRRRLMRGSESGSFQPGLAFGRDGVIRVSTWMLASSGRRLARVWSASFPDDSGRVSVLADPMYELVGPGEAWPMPAWIVSRPDSTGRPSELRLLVARGEGFAVAASIRSPYTGFFAALMDDQLRLVIAGPLQGTAAGEPIVVTQLLRAQLACPRAL